MTKFHVNDNGEVQKCSSTKGLCPFLNKDENRHFETEAEAYKSIEDKMGSSQASLNKKNVKPKFDQSEITPLLSDSLNLDLLNKMVKEKYIMRSAHPDDDTLQILCYGRATQFQARWNDATKLARGLIVQSSRDDFSDAVIVQRPWKKFYTLSQMSSGWHLGDEEDGASDAANSELDLLDFDAPAEVTDKLDGSMGILYTAPDGLPALSTKGSFQSDQAIFYTDMLRRNDKFLNASSALLKKHPDTTFTFELLSKGEHQIVLNYDEDDISMIGAIKKSNGLYHSVSDYSNIWGADKGLTTAEVMKANNLKEAFELPDRENREGVVVRVVSDDPERQMQIKIKQEDYLKLHKMRTQFSKKDARETLRGTKATYADLLKLYETKDVTMFPEVAQTIEDTEKAGVMAQRFRNERVGFYEEALLPRAEAVVKVKNFVDDMPDDMFEKDKSIARKEFAELVKKDKSGMDKDLMFKFFQARLNNTSIDNSDAMNEMKKASQS